jgi:hypothetical protein
VGGAPCTPSSRNRWREHEMCWTSAEFRAQANGTFGMMRLAFLHQKTSPPLHEEAVERQTGLVHNLINAAVDNRLPLPSLFELFSNVGTACGWSSRAPVDRVVHSAASTYRTHTKTQSIRALLADTALRGCPWSAGARTSSSIEDRRYADFLYGTHRTANNTQCGRVAVSVTPAATINLKHQAH